MYIHTYLCTRHHARAIRAHHGYVRHYIWICVYVYIYIYIHTCICVYIHAYVCTYINMDMKIYVPSISSSIAYAHVYTYVYIHTYVYIYMYICIYVYLYIYIYIYIYIYAPDTMQGQSERTIDMCNIKCAYVYIHIYIYLLTYICVYTHTYIYIYRRGTRHHEGAIWSHHWYVRLICMCVCIYIYVYVDIHTRIRVYVYTSIYLYIYMKWIRQHTTWAIGAHYLYVQYYSFAKETYNFPSLFCKRDYNFPSLFCTLWQKRPIIKKKSALCAILHMHVYICACLFVCITYVCTFFDGYCSTVQGLLDWFEVDLGFTKLSFIQIDLCVLCVFVLDITYGCRPGTRPHRCVQTWDHT